MTAATAREAQEAAVEAAEAKIVGFASLPSGWCGGDEEPLTENTIQLAKSLAQHTPGVSSQRISLSPDGEIWFSWFAPRSRVEAVIDNNGTLTVLGKINEEWFPTVCRPYEGGRSEVLNARIAAMHDAAPPPEE